MLPGELNVLQAHSTAQFFCPFSRLWITSKVSQSGQLYQVNTGARQDQDGQTQEKHGNAELLSANLQIFHLLPP
jgi:hypothetical protein